MCHFDQICTNNLSAYSETEKENKKKPGSEGSSKSWLGSGKPGVLGWAPMISVKFIEHILCAILSAKHVTHIISLIPHTT